MQSFTFKPIGIVRNDIEEGSIPEDWSDIISEIKIYSKYAKGLEGLEQFRRILVVFVFHKAHQTKLKLHPRGDKSRPMRGVFATRSPMRPNKIGVAEVELVQVRGNIIIVKGLDVLNGTPVIDVKSTDNRRLAPGAGR
jgi:tRNA-Thr(GGU) m(6)t(6)A37 methyltransferase TsaA